MHVPHTYVWGYTYRVRAALVVSLSKQARPSLWFCRKHAAAFDLEILREG